MSVLLCAYACGARTGLGAGVWVDQEAGSPSDAGGDPVGDMVVDARPDAPTLVSVPSISIAGSPISPARACALNVGGDVKCWGEAPIGTGTEQYASTAIDIPSVQADSAQVSVMGQGGVCVLRRDGTVSCWGNDSLELGLGVGDGSMLDDAGSLPVPTLVSGVSASRISVGGSYEIAMTAGASSITWWGASNADQGLPQTIDVGAPVSDAASGAGFACVLLSDGRIRCWGNNAAGQLGDGSYVSSNVPTFVAGVTTAVAIAAGEAHACALLASGAVLAWGADGAGQLGDALDASDSSPVPVPVAASGATVLRAGGLETCVIANDHTVTCWGTGSLGDGSSPHRFPPTKLTVANVVDIGLAHARSCALLSSGGAECWGSGPLGDGEPAGASSPTLVSVVGLP